MEPFSWSAFFVSLAISAVVTTASYFLRPSAKQPGVSPATLDEIDFPTAEEGRPLPVLFGRRWVGSGCCVWYGDLGTEEIKTSGGGK